MDEYLPKVVKHPKKPPVSVVAKSSRALQVEVKKSAGTQHALRVKARRPGELNLALHSFPGWSVKTTSGPEPVSLETSAEGLVALRFPQPGTYEVQVEFGSTPVRMAAFGLSTWSALSVWPLAFWLERARRRRKKTVEERSET